MSVNSITEIYSNVQNNSNFGKVHAVLKKSNYENLIQTTTDVEILKQKFLGSQDIKKISKKEEFFHLITYMFQSLTNIGYTTYEILDFITTALTDGGLSETDVKDMTKFISGSFCFVHSDYSKTSIWKNKKKKKILENILFGHSNKDNFNMGLVFGQQSAVVVGKSPSFKRDIKTLSTFTGVTSSNTGVTQTQNYNNLVKVFNESSLNSNIRNPSKTRPSVSSVLITDPRIRIGTQNNLELSTFFNGLTTLEMNRSYPFVNATFVLPTLSRQVKVKKDVHEITAKSSTISSFLFAGENKTDNYERLGGDTVSVGVRRANMSLFTTPQTLVNFDEPIGHNQNQTKKNRINTVNDPTQPFMTITGFNINTAPTKGLMSYKTGTLNVILHDRTRMPEIAPFVKPDLLGSFGAEIVIEYGWSNPDQDNEKNPMGYFIGNSKIVEKYMIVNSSLSLDNSGQVNINLSLAMKGPHQFKNQKISTKISGRIKESEFRNKLAFLDYNRNAILSNNNNYIEQYKINSNLYSDIFSETSRMTESVQSALTNFVNTHTRLLNAVNGNIKNFIDVTLFKDEKTFNIDISGNKDVVTTFAKLLSTQTTNNITKNIKSGKITLSNKNENNLTASQIYFYIKEIYNSVEEICTYIRSIKSQDLKEGDNERKIIETVMGSAQYIDHFYPTDNYLYPKNNPTSYISFGSVVNTIVQSFIANKENNFDEIQTIFYNANEYAGKMSNKNISNFLIPRKLLKNLLKDIFQKNVVITPESLITQIILKCIKRKDNISLGLSDLYEPINDDPLKPLEIKRKIKDEGTFEPERNKKLKIIYGLNEKFPDEDLRFVLPVIHMNFDCLTSNSIENSSRERTILRISIFDKADSPFQSSSRILENVYSGKINKVIENIVANRKDFDQKRNKNNRNTSEKFTNRHKEELDLLKEKKLIKYNSEKKVYTINAELFKSNNSKFVGDVKSVFKEIYPSLTYGSQNSIMTSANVSTVNDNKLGTIFITRADRNDQSLINNRVDEEMPLLIMPTQATVEIFGCPWVNFGQSIFLDFETGTTLDNKYVVTGITHNLAPGKFSTQLTLTYGDNYGQLRNANEMLNESGNFSTPKKRKKPATKKASVGDDLSITIKSNYLKDPDRVDMPIPRISKK